MSAEVQVAVVNEALKLSDMFRQNAAMRHGIPRVNGPERINRLEESQTAPAQPAVTPTHTEAADTPSPSGAVAAADTRSRSLLSRAAPFLVGGALASAVPAGWMLGDYFHADDPPDVVQPADGDLLQWLQRNGRHLPEGWQ